MSKNKRLNTFRNWHICKHPKTLFLIFTVWWHSKLYYTLPWLHKYSRLYIIFTFPDVSGSSPCISITILWGVNMEPAGVGILESHVPGHQVTPGFRTSKVCLQMLCRALHSSLLSDAILAALIVTNPNELFPAWHEGLSWLHLWLVGSASFPSFPFSH